MRTQGPVAIIGLGLIGGSLALRLRREDQQVWAHARSPETRSAAEQHGIRAYADLPEMLTALPEGATLVIATPMEPALASLPKIAEHTGEGVTVTDVVSVKGPLVAAAREAGLAHRFVGAHPMAGTAESGFDAADPDLLTGATWVITLDQDTDLQRWAQVCDLALQAGGRVVPADSEWHDHAAAWISHLPHVLAELLASNVEPRSLLGSLAAGSYRDATRVALTRPELVEAMLVGNRRMLTEALESLLDQLEQATLGVRDGDVRTLLERGHANRTEWEQRRTETGPGTRCELSLASPDIRQRLLDLGAAGGFVLSHESGRLTALT
ncbi:prephenate dehydrogenase/arogenate dehydrogenase family protein [Blastococcus sp. Marseille-P5729]|uniref:prephenate dehydrogenase n=1 Tax=Blastococcus sp. Marseille-P5729 TaxID=2086582 RepID=UPI000D1112DC|nr:prephenate dehydrogenase/arogenate dehydrogenase family protein [Blastococcus sp. Marseille-P5729]